MGLDHDEELGRMCPKCREEATSHDKCSRCGKPLAEQGFVNPNFDKSKFERLKDEDGGVVNENFDGERFQKLE